MRRFFVYVAALGFLGTFAMGCCCRGGGGGHVHGVCDCYQLSPCCTRQPWVSEAPPAPVETPPLEGKKL